MGGFGAYGGVGCGAGVRLSDSAVCLINTKLCLGSGRARLQAFTQNRGVRKEQTQKRVLACLGYVGRSGWGLGLCVSLLLYFLSHVDP